MTKGNEWAMKFEAVSGKLTNAQYANLAIFFNNVIEEEREACRAIAEYERDRARRLQDDCGERGRDMFRRGITQGRAQCAALIELMIRKRSNMNGG